MPDLYIDSFKLACPEGEDGLEIFEMYIRDIISMGELLNVNWLKIYVSAKLTEVLVETDSYPLWKEIEKAIDYLGLQDEIPLRSVFYTINLYHYSEYDSLLKYSLLANVLNRKINHKCLC